MIDVDHCTDLDALRDAVKSLRHTIGKRDRNITELRTQNGRARRKLEEVTAESIARRRHIEHLLSELDAAAHALDAAGQDDAALRALKASRLSAPGDNHPRDRNGIRQEAA
jgi:chromosome segregation ATPase